MPIKTSHNELPPFPSDIETAPLISFSLAKLQIQIPEESEALFKACKELGFFYLRLEGSELGEQAVECAEQLLNVQKQFFTSPQEEKDAVARVKIDPFFGYRSGDSNPGPAKHETYNMRKDDILGFADPPLPCHAVAKANNNILKLFVGNCRAIIDVLFMNLESQLGLQQGTLAQYHRIYEPSGDHVRFLQFPATPYNEAIARAAEHTDFGSLTVLFNWLGGLQIRRPDTGKWVYVKPLPGTAIVNLGDALVKFTAGILRSNVHRVAAPPPPQDTSIRYSLVYHCRPEDKTVLRRLKGGLIDAQPVENEAQDNMTAQEWTLRRSVGDLKGVFTYHGGLERQTVSAN